MHRSEIHEAKCREWSKRIRDWSASGLTKVEWCSKNHVSVKCLQYWLKRIPETAQANCFSSQSADVPGNNNDFFELVPGAASGCDELEQKVDAGENKACMLHKKCIYADNRSF